MIIMVNQGFPLSPVYSMSPQRRQEIISRIQSEYPPALVQELKQMGLMLGEMIGLVFVDELVKGWISRCLRRGKLFSSDGKPLRTARSVREALAGPHNRYVHFRASSGSSSDFLDSLMRR